MLDNLSNKFNKVIKYLKGEARINENNITNAVREIKLSLLEADVNYKVVKEFINTIKEKALGEDVKQSLTPHQHIVKIVQEEIQKLLGNEIKNLNTSSKKPAILLMVGLQGTGKTTTAGKLALFLKKQNKSVILASLDLKRLAAEDQLKTIAQEIDVQCFKRTNDKPKKIIKNLLRETKEYGYDYLIVDTAGRLHIDSELMEELSFLKDQLSPIETMFIADSLTGQDAVNSAKSFLEEIGIDSIILTKLDADSRGGAALSIVSVTDKPIKFIGVGENYNDFLPFHPDRLASKILGMGDMLTLIEKAEQEFDEKETKRISKKMLKNEFDLDDFKNQMQQMQKLGSLNDIIKMLPNIGPMGRLDSMVNSSDIDDKKIKHTIAIINSMTPFEKRNPHIINGRRRLRISKGSGRMVMEINQLLKNFKNMKKMMKKPFLKKMFKKFDF